MSEPLVIEITNIRAGQPKAYADSFYEYEIKINNPHREHTVKELCTKVLRPCTQTKEEWKANMSDPGKYFSGYYEFTKVDDTTFKYLKVEPFTD